MFMAVRKRKAVEDWNMQLKVALFGGEKTIMKWASRDSKGRKVRINSKQKVTRIIESVRKAVFEKEEEWKNKEKGGHFRVSAQIDDAYTYTHQAARQQAALLAPFPKLLLPPLISPLFPAFPLLFLVFFHLPSLHIFILHALPPFTEHRNHARGAFTALLALGEGLFLFPRISLNSLIVSALSPPPSTQDEQI